MRAVTYTTYGGPEVLSVTEEEQPHARPGQIRIAVRAASVNPIDWKIRSGAHGDGTISEPQIPGSDAAGVVDEVGDGVTGVSVGDEVFGLASRAYAEFAVMRAWARKPADVDWATAAAAGVAGETSVRALDLLGLQAGAGRTGDQTADTLFVAGGTGGVGTVAVQLGRARGLTVIASGGAANQDYLRELGAVPVVYGAGEVAAVRSAAGRDRVDGVFDVVGKAPADDLLALVAEPSRVVSIANFGLAGRGAQVTSGAHGDPQAALAEVAGLLADGRLRIPVESLPLDRAAQAHARSADGHVRGKLVLIP
jgi:NADPH:quinone reductase-like Zn-dependent oxidoreductase